MKQYKVDFLAFVIERKVLCFGAYTLKSGRVSPYFFNSGLFNDGASLAALGRFYAAAIIDSGLKFDMLFGPAYKGIPLVAAVAIALADNEACNYPYAFNRKEAKDHGEGGVIVGAPLQGQVLIVDDVISAGTSIRESVSIIEEAGASANGVVIALDRKEKGGGELSAIHEIENDYVLAVTSIISLSDVIEYLDHSDPSAYTTYLSAIKTYRARYGVE